MTLPGETLSTGAPRTCPTCGTALELQVCCSNAYYIGCYCECGPYSRESGYYGSEEEARAALEGGGFERG